MRWLAKLLVPHQHQLSTITLTFPTAPAAPPAAPQPEEQGAQGNGPVQPDGAGAPADTHQPGSSVVTAAAHALPDAVAVTLGGDAGDGHTCPDPSTAQALGASEAVRSHVSTSASAPVTELQCWLVSQISRLQPWIEPCPVCACHGMPAVPRPASGCCLARCMVCCAVLDHVLCCQTWKFEVVDGWLAIYFEDLNHNHSNINQR